MIIKDFLMQDHRDCDELFAQAEEAVHSGDDKAQSITQKFVQELNHHLDMEETVMFPAFEAQTGMTQGPTAMMRMEHSQMRQMAEELLTKLEDKKSFFSLSETLMMLMQQHNMKEEQMLYPMADQHLSAISQDLVTQMKAI